MKTKLLLTIALFSTLQIFAQTNGWYLYTKASTISKIVPDNTNVDELHLATDIGYIKYNTTSEMVTDYLNLTTQNPAIGRVNGLSLNPTNNNIALALDEGIAIYDGTAVTIYNYDNSALTAGSTGNLFTKLEVRYGRQGQLYIFRPNVTGYQLFNAGVFDVEVATAIRPQDIIENQAGTMVFFAGWNDGLHMLEKATTTWTNYTTSNSVLITNTLKSLHVDANDLLYVGGFQGLNTMTPAGVWSTYQQSAPPPSDAFFLPVYEISVDEATEDLLIRTSEPNTSFFGLTQLDLTTNIWTNYTDDNTNCLNANVFMATAVDSSGKIYASVPIGSNSGQLTEFNPGTNTCTQPDINYLNAPTAVNSSVISDFALRKAGSSPTGDLSIGFTRGESLHIGVFQLEVFDETDIMQTITTILPSAGQSVFSVIADNDFFIAETNTGWVFVNGTNTTTEVNHNLPNNLAITTKIAAAFDSSDGIINLVHKGFDSAFNYRMYKTQCNTATATCSAPEEMFTNDRDLTKNIVFGVSQDNTTNQVSVVAVKTDGSGDIKRTLEQYDGNTNGTPTITWSEDHDVFPQFDPAIFEYLIIPQIIAAFTPDIYTITLRDEIGNISNYTFDVNNDGVIDRIGSISVGHLELAPEERNTFILGSVFDLSFGSAEIYFINIDPFDSSTIDDYDLISDMKIDNNLPEDIFIKKTEIKQYNSTDIFMVILTNYGLLIKTAIDISNLLLSTDDVSLKDANLLLYPNPASDIVSFSDNTIKNVEVYDINGRKVLSTINSNSFSVKTLAKGLYIVKGTSDNNVVVTKKLIVE
ncbi:T9SS type A sorting domain-containing protein [Olleya sp. AH-315-F22]|nr:T9SS type A sorting domain-containing protein [Olleya sp. AH-315-F22]